ncbi:MAG: hypothetical protein ACKVHE_34630 [Planctomycetales bacterium]
MATPALADRVTQLAVEFSQRQVLSVLREAHHVCWGVTTLRKVTRAMTEAMSPFRHQAQVEQVLTWLQQASDADGPRRIVLSAGRDGVMLPMLGHRFLRLPTLQHRTDWQSRPRVDWEIRGSFPWTFLISPCPEQLPVWGQFLS